jgi:hypothetical protein
MSGENATKLLEKRELIVIITRKFCGTVIDD